jgi:hypothetical protein
MLFFRGNNRFVSGQVYERTAPLGADADEKDFVLLITSSKNGELIRYEPAKNKQNPIPEPAKACLAPADVENTEQLFLTAQHLEQYRHATYSPVPYYEEALKARPERYQEQ